MADWIFKRVGIKKYSFQQKRTHFVEGSNMLKRINFFRSYSKVKKSFNHENMSKDEIREVLEYQCVRCRYQNVNSGMNDLFGPVRGLQFLQTSSFPFQVLLSRTRGL